MKIKLFFNAMLLLMLALVPLSGLKAQEKVTLTMGSWRTDDAQVMAEVLAAFNEQYPNITIQFDPTNPPDYNATLQTQLQSGNAPDLFYLRSFATSLNLFKQGYLEPLTDLPGLATAFSDASRVPWTTTDGVTYGVPFIAVSHGIYYNADLFKASNVEIPTTWNELLAAAQTFRDAGVDPFANGSGEPWTIAEIVFMNLAPTFIGGREARLAYLNGERCFNDADAVSAFQAIKDLAPFLPDGQEALKDADTQQIFLQGEAAMRFGGSWDIAAFEAQAPSFEWSVFAVPAPEGKQGVVTFHLDAGMGLNAKSTHKEEAKLFLQWMATSEFATLFANKLPGFFPLLENADLSLDNPHSDAFLKMNEGRTTDIRWAWEGLLDSDPNGYNLMQDGAVAIIAGTKTPQQAADDLQNGLATWLPAAQQCGSAAATAEATASK